MMIEDGTPTHERRKLVKTYKNVKNGPWFLKYAGRPTPKMIKSWSRKTTIDVKYMSPQTKGER